MSFLTPLALLTGLLALPIILLYMLRLRRREVLVSSTFLWQQILQDNEANTPWQRLKRNLLLLLQLLILALLAFGLARPYIIVPAVSTGEIVLLLDASASMNATDTNTAAGAAATRFDEAKRRALEIIDTLSAGDTVTLIRVADVPEVLTPSTNDRDALRAAIERAQPSHARADWDAALTLARSRAEGTENFSTVIISDGGLGDLGALPEMPGETRYVQIGSGNSNVAISALATRALPGETPELFAQITNFGGEDADVIFSLSVDGALFTAERYTVPAGESLPLVSEALPEGFGSLQADLTLPTDATTPDYLPDDNAAWAVAGEGGLKRALLVTPGNLFLEQILRSLPGWQTFKSDPDAALPTQEFDLYIFDGTLPDSLPDADLFIIDPPGSTPLFTVGPEQDELGTVIVARDDPRTTYVDFDAVNVLAYHDVSAEWADTLVEAENGPLVLAGEVEGRQVAILTFDLHDSDLPLQITWPILMANLLDWFTPQQAISIPEGLSVSDSLVVRPPLTADTIRITGPDGSARDIPIERETVVYADTHTPGIYTLDVLEGGDVLQSAPFAVNLFDANESDITPGDTLLIGNTTITEAAREEVGQREFWPYAALLALLFLLIEWYVYHQRLRTPTMLRPVLRRKSA